MITINGITLKVDLITIGVKEFDAILGIDFSRNKMQLLTAITARKP